MSASSLFSVVVFSCLPAAAPTETRSKETFLQFHRTAANEATVKGMPVSFADRWHLTQRLQPRRKQKTLATVGDAKRWKVVDDDVTPEREHSMSTALQSDVFTVVDVSIVVLFCHSFACVLAV